MNQFVEGHLAFTFGPHWNETALKFDAPKGVYKKISNQIEGTKGIDFLGICGQHLIFIEVKDFRDYRIQNKKRITDGELALEIAQKVRDSIACIVGGGRTSDEEQWSQFAKLLIDKQKQLRVILWLEDDTPSSPQSQRKSLVAQSVLRHDLERRLNWLTSKVIIHNLKKPLPNNFDLQVGSLSFNQ